MTVKPLALSDGPDLELKPLAPADAPTLFRVVDANRAYVGRYLPWVETTTAPGDSRAFIEACVRDWGTGAAAHFGIYVHGELVGHISLQDIVAGHKAAIGYWLAESAAGQGVMKRATRLVVDLAFARYGLRRLIIRARAGNGPSAGVAKALGFLHEGTEHLGEKHGHDFYDLENYYLLSPEASHAR